ncbi:uncharacterized protein LOC135706623 [Ochlerotatus camptorhynchus]|uniref:uncharacterized protein LOC135706623 n=1 Tax=Ochlerotatus camptorhynchus TaxID=644619 RepID=UPI0031CF7A9A
MGAGYRSPFLQATEVDGVCHVNETGNPVTNQQFVRPTRSHRADHFEGKDFAPRIMETPTRLGRGSPTSICYARLEVQGFIDASEAAYGACLYLRSITSAGSCTVRLLMSKSKVAPIDTKSIPRLELCAALLLSKLLVQAMDSFDISATIYLWTDSTIVLNWLSATPSTWKTFVANRIAEIQELTIHAVWNHVPSKNSAADFISRGMNLDELERSSLWWHGPQWLGTLAIPWPGKYSPTKSLPSDESEARKIVVLPVVEDETTNDLVFRYFSLRPLLRIGSLIRRFAENCRRRKNHQDPLVGPLTATEIDQTLLALVHRAQEQHFEKEIRQLFTTYQVDRKSKLRYLHPQLVDDIIRVGGRLHNAQIPIEEKYPIILPAKHRLTEMIATKEHQKTLHAGPGLLLSSLRQRFWPLGGRNLVRQVIHRCMTCARAKPKSLEQLMGQLPPVRVNQAHPFQNVGIDLAGPIYVRTSPLISISCLTSPARHSLPAFENFVGARRELEELRKLFMSQQHKESVARECSENGIQFHYIPPRSPSFGGIWEACVLSVKTLLRKILGNAHLTEPELQTALVQVEAMLNSRSITPLSDDPSDEFALTPGHFLIGRPLNAMPNPDQQDIPESRLTRWRREYLVTLQNRYRWNQVLDNLAIGSIVALKDENVPPQKWPLGRVISIHPGTDGRVRVATVKISSGTTKRAISKLCLLPVEIDPAIVTANVVQNISNSAKSSLEEDLRLMNQAAGPAPGPCSGNRAAGRVPGPYSGK